MYICSHSKRAHVCLPPTIVSPRKRGKNFGTRAERDRNEPGQRASYVNSTMGAVVCWSNFVRNRAWSVSGMINDTNVARNLDFYEDFLRLFFAPWNLIERERERKTVTIKFRIVCILKMIWIMRQKDYQVSLEFFFFLDTARRGNSLIIIIIADLSNCSIRITWYF